MNRIKLGKIRVRNCIRECFKNKISSAWIPAALLVLTRFPGISSDFSPRALSTPSFK